MERSAYDTLRAVENRHWWFSGRREIVTAQLERLNLPANAAILEVGCASGGNLAMLAAFGTVTAVEPDDESRVHAAGLGIATVMPGSLPDGLPAFKKPFDLVVALDVLEHVEDDAGSLAALLKLVAPCGRLLLTVPANAWMWSGHDVRHHHKRRYSLKGLTGVAEAAGWSVSRATYFNSLLFPPIAAVRLAKSVTGGESDDDAMPGESVNRLLHSVFSSEAKLLNHTDLPMGVSILLVAERPSLTAS